jgi:hypothetical protein
MLAPQVQKPKISYQPLRVGTPLVRLATGRDV